MSLLRSLSLFALLILVAVPGLAPASREEATDMTQLLDRAEALRVEGSYRSALPVYREAQAEAERRGDAASLRFIRFRLADVSWRDWAATQDRDSTQLEQARKELNAMIAALPRAEDRDALWVECQESLGDSHWIPQQTRSWYTAWNHYQAALDWWAGSTEIDLARERYLSIIRKAVQPPDTGRWHYFGQYGNQLPLPILEKTLSIADDRADRAMLNYQMAMTLRYQGGDWRQLRRIPALFEAAIEASRGTDWRDDAIYQYAQWLAQVGPVEVDDEGDVSNRPDYVEAVRRYRQLLGEYGEGESRWHRQAQNELARIVDPQLHVAVSNAFLPGGEVRYVLNSRNLAGVDLTLTAIDLSGDLFDTPQGPGHDWLTAMDLPSGNRVARWSLDRPDYRDHRPFVEELTLEQQPAGAYVLEARSGKAVSRTLVLVTDLSLVIKSSGRTAMAYVSDAQTGSPVAGATVHAWQLGYNRNDWHWDAGSRTTDADGLAHFKLPHDGNQLILAARAGERQTIGRSGTYRRPSDHDTWHVYTFADRPAYRPGETAKFKVIARLRSDGAYRTPAGETLDYTIRDARWAELAKGRLTLNDYGSAWAELPIEEAWTLGEVRIELTVPSRKTGAGQFPLFRIEEYKLPEFKVNVETPTDDEGKRKIFVLGDTISADVVAEYTFGGAVAGAAVDVLVHQSSFYRYGRPRPYAWLYEQNGQHQPWRYGEQVVHRELLQTDAEGRATVRFQTPFGQNQDFQYRIEARVTDASRREIVGQGTLRVGRRSYAAALDADHVLYRPGDRVKIEVRTSDANEDPVEVGGKVTVVRRNWDDRKHRGGLYRETEIDTFDVTTNAEGRAEIEFKATREGYYAVRWFSRDRDGAPVRGETTVWVCDASTRSLGYQHGGVDLLIDRDTVRAGETLPVMVSVPVSNRWVLFTVEADGLLEHRVVHVPDRVRLIELEIDDRHVPNVHLTATMIHDLRAWVDTEQLMVPPVRHFLEIELEYDQPKYLPREDGRVTVTTRDVDGNPVSAEVALALVDQSVFYIQSDYAGDPRRTFFGALRSPGVQSGSSLQMHPFFRPEPEEERRRGEKNEGEFSSDLRVVGFSRGADNVRQDAPMAARKMAVAESMAPGDDADQPGGVNVQVRSDFRSTVLWMPDVVTGDDGRATVDVTFPESLTTWQLTARAATAESAFGIAKAEAKTHQPVILRLQNPRFLVVGDEATISGIVRNDGDREMSFDTTIELDGLELAGRNAERFTLRPGEERRVDWTVNAETAGKAVLVAKTVAGDLGDAVSRELPVLEHGIDKLIARAARLADGHGTVLLDLPRERREGSTRMSVQVTPSLAVTMLDALPYLIDYPYGCTEQTMSRFLPAAIVARTFEELGLDPDRAMRKLYGGIEQEHLDKTQPKGRGRSLSRATRKGLDRLYDLQRSDGGWGWWKGGESDAYMTAYVVWGLSIAEDAGIRIKDGVIERGYRVLQGRLVEFESSPDLQSFLLFAMTAVEGSRDRRFEEKAFGNLMNQRDRLNAYTRALLALSADALGHEDQAQLLVRNLANGVKIDDDPANSKVQRGQGVRASEHDMKTAHWGADGFWWRWSEGPVETTAFVLRAMVAIDPDNALIPQATNWLIQNRRGAQWSNTRDTAIVLLALTDYLKASGEIRGRHGFELKVNGEVVDRVSLEGEDLIAAPSRFVIAADQIRSGTNRVEVRRTQGEGPLYVTAQIDFFSLEEPVTPAGHQLFVRRQYNRIVNQPTLLQGTREKKTPLLDGGRLESGDRVEVVLTIETKNDYEYLLFEDLKPAGLEAVEVRSGGALYASELKPSAVDLRLDGGVDQVDLTGATRWVYRELRDQKVALFIDKLPQGVWEIRYTLRAETPGAFHALPLMGHAMYVPEIRANGAEQRVTVVD